MLSPSQIRAARAILNWNQATLAKQADLHVNALRSIESGSSKARAKTDMRLRAVFEAEGIVFRGTGGVEFNNELCLIDRISSNDYITLLSKDIVATLKTGDELCTVTHDDRLFKKTDPSGTALYYRERRKQKFIERCIVPSKSAHYSEKTHYRHLPPSLIGPVSWAVYKDRVCFVHWDANEGILIRNRQFAATYRAMFEALWMLARD